MKLDYTLDQKVPFIKSFLFGIQWAAILVPSIIILGKVAASVHLLDASAQINYLQILFFACGITLLCQVFWGHRLPLIPGPSAVLLTGLIAGQGSGFNTIYTSVMIGGLFIALLSVSGLFIQLRRLFTVNVITVVLLLIAFMLAPTIMNLIIDNETGARALYNLFFALGLIFLTFLFYGLLKGIWKSTLIIWAAAAGVILYFIVFPGDLKVSIPLKVIFRKGLFDHIIFPLSFEPGLILSFIFCFVALSINDLGSIQSVNELLETKDQDKRISKGIFFTGLANIFSGLMGVIAIFLPDHVINLLHPSLKPLLGNGLVIGVLSAIILEQIAVKRK